MDKQILEQEKQNLRKLISQREELVKRPTINKLEEVCKEIQITYLSMMISKICEAFQRNGVEFKL